jgi:hypothetical protein
MIADVVLGSILILVSIVSPFRGIFLKTILSPLGGVLLLGIGIVAVGAWFFNRSVAEGGEEAETGSGARAWFRWLVSVSAGLLLLSFLPVLSHTAGEEYSICLVFFILPCAAIMILSAFRFHFVSFLVGLWVLVLSSSFGLAPFHLALAALICILSPTLGVLGVIRALKQSGWQQVQP